MLLRTKLALAVTATAAAAAGATAVVVANGTTQTLVPATAYADAATSPSFTNWFEPSGALVPKGTAGCDNDADRLVVRTDQVHYRDGTADPKPHPVNIPRPAGTSRLGTDSQVARLRDGRLVYLESGHTKTPFAPKPGWEAFGDWDRTTFELYTSQCGDEWTHALTIDTKDFAKGACAWPQHKDGSPRPGGFDRAELYVDPYGGDVYISTACRGGTAPDFAAEHLYRRMLLFRLTPEVSAWTLTAEVQLNYGVPIAMTSTSDGSVYLLRCDYLNRPQLIRLADRGTRLISVSDVQAPGESTAAARCARDWDVSSDAIWQKQKAPELRLAPAGARRVRIAYLQLFDGRPQIRYYEAGMPPLPAGRPCAAQRTAYLAQFELPDEGNVLPFPECGPVPSFGKPRVVRRDGGSIVHFDLIAPDSTALSSPGAMASSLLYWMEHDVATKQREERYLTISANGAWSPRRTISAAPWRPNLADPTADRDGDYEYGGYAFVDGRCRYALVWNQSHDKPQGPNLFAHYAIVDDLACTGTPVAPSSPTPSATKAPPTTAPATTKPPATTAPPATSAPPTVPPTSGPPPTAPPKFTVQKVTLAVQTCTQNPDRTWRCPYAAQFTFTPGAGGSFSWRIAGTLRHDCYPSQGGGTETFATGMKILTVSTGQATASASGYLSFAKAPNPPEVYGQPGQASDAQVRIDGSTVRSQPPTPFYSNATCGKP